MKKLIKRTAATVFAVGMLVLASMETQELGADPITGWPFADDPRCTLSNASGSLCGTFCYPAYFVWDHARRIWVPVWTCYWVRRCTLQDGPDCVAPRH